MLAIISDVHGNYPALKAVMDEIDHLECEHIVSLGDVAGYYCMINECIDLMRRRNTVKLMGNHDDYLVRNTPCPRSNSANKCLDYQRLIITSENLQWLADAVESVKLNNISMVHAGWNDSLDEYLYELSVEYFADKQEKYFFSGHTHVQMVAELGDKTYCNPGSVGQPRDGDWRAAFAVLHNEQVYLKRVEYDVDFIATTMKNAGFDSYYYSNLYEGTRIGGQISQIHINK